jgi:hypothetical protein
MTDYRDPVTGLADAEHEALAEELYAQRASLGGDTVEAVVDPAVRSVVSVRFNRGELAAVVAAADAAGLPLSTFIRNAALATVGSIDIDAARRDLASLIKRVEELRKHLGDAA